MTQEEKKYEEFRQLGYDHQQAREMMFKHFELTPQDPSVLDNKEAK